MGTSASGMERIGLTAEDQAILAKESPTVVGHTCKVVMLGPGLDVVDLRTSLSRRIVATPILTRRLGGSPRAPCWVTDDHFALNEHIVDGSGTTPLAPEELKQRVASLFADRLDRRRPLWRIDVLGPLWDGGTALVWRLHHALADGQTAVRLAAALLWDPPGSAGRRQAKLTRAAAEAQRSHLRHRQNLLGVLAREFGRAPGPSPFDGRIGARRQISFCSTSLRDLRAGARALDASATVNDAILACVAGGLQRWLGLHGQSLRSVRCKVPVSLHRGEDAAANRDSFFFVDLPISGADLPSRLRAIRRETALRKQSHDAQAMDHLLADLRRSFPHLKAACDRFLFDPRRFAINVSTVKGPSAPVSVLGIPVRQMYSIADIAERHALRVATFSLGDQISFGFCADPDLIDDLDGLAEAVGAEARDLASAATQR